MFFSAIVCLIMLAKKKIYTYINFWINNYNYKINTSLIKHVYIIHMCLRNN